MSFTPRDWRTILVDKLSYITAESPISSVSPGSIIATICEATSLEDGEQYFQMLEIIRNYSLNTTTGNDLDKRAQEYTLTRRQAQEATTYVTIGDSGIIKRNTKIYSGFSGPKSGDLIVYGNDRTGFPNSGSIIIGRGTGNVETVSYSSITEFTNYVLFNLSSALSNDHGTDETITLSQGGNRVVPSGTRVKVAENDISPEVVFILDTDVTLLDGEQEVERVSVTSEEPGSKGNVPAGLINEFVIKPFSTATVINPIRVTNGTDIESDEELRDRIKLHIQGLSRGVKSAILSSIIGLEDRETNKRVISANVIESNELGFPSICYIDDGTGFEPSYEGQGYEVVLEDATGGEKRLQLDMYPIVKAFLISNKFEPFNMTGVLELSISVNSVPETITFSSSDFDNASQATAEELIKAINLRSSLLEARTTDSGRRVIIFGKSLSNENIAVTGGTANTILQFPEKESTTLFLYKNYRTLLNKDGATASIESGNPENYGFLDGDTLLVKIDGRSGYQIITLLSTDVTAELVASKMNLQLQGATVVSSSNDTKVSIFSNTENSTESKVKIGRAGVVSGAVSGAVFFDSTLSTDFPWIGQLVGLRLKMTSGTYSGNAQVISAYSPSSGQITLASSIGGTPGLGDTYIIDGTANGNTGNPSTTTGKLSFSTIEARGDNKDYTLNRSQGQIELEEILGPGDRITAGTRYTRGQVTTSVNGDYVFLSPSSLIVSVDSGSGQTINFSASTYSPAQIVTEINNQLLGGRAFISIENTSKVSIRTNQWSTQTGSIQVLGGTANTVLKFSTDGDMSLVPHFPFLESGNAYNESTAQEYTFSNDSNLVIVLDSVLSSPYTIIMSFNGTVTLGDNVGPYNTFRDSSYISNFTINNFFKDFFLKWTTGANLNKMRKIVSYDSITGEFVLDSAVSNPISVGDTFVVIPRTAQNISKFFSSTVITGLGQKAQTEETYTNKLMISSLIAGSEGSVNVTGGTANNISLMFSSDGTALGTFQSTTKTGFMVGQQVVIGDSNTAEIGGFITSITGTGPYTFEVSDARESGSLLDLSNYLISENAYMKPKNLLNFSTVISYGFDAYTYYTGLLQKVQWTIDGREDDEENYPGVKAAGAQVEVKPPSTNRIIISIDVTTIEGVSLSSLQEEVKVAVSSYVNNLGVSQDLIVSEIINRVKSVTGVYDVDIIEPTSNIAVGDDEIVRVYNSDIIVG